jgi:hypothetical protein
MDEGRLVAILEALLRGRKKPTTLLELGNKFYSQEGQGWKQKSRRVTLKEIIEKNPDKFELIDWNTKTRTTRLLRCAREAVVERDEPVENE